MIGRDWRVHKKDMLVSASAEIRGSRMGTEIKTLEEIARRARIDWVRFGEPARTAEALYKATVASQEAQGNPNFAQSAVDKICAKVGEARDLHNIELKRFHK